MTNPKNRFTKPKLIDALEAYATNIRLSNGFKRDHGTHQCLPKNPTDREKELLKRAHQYGRATAAEDFANWVDRGEFGV